MRSRARSTVTVDHVNLAEDTAELAKLGPKMGRNVSIVADEESPGALVILLQSREDKYLIEEISSLVAIHSVAADESVDSLLAQVRAQIVSWHHPVDKKPSDARPIGSGHVDDE